MVTHNGHILLFIDFARELLQQTAQLHNQLLSVLDLVDIIPQIFQYLLAIFPESRVVLLHAVFVLIPRFIQLADVALHRVQTQLLFVGCVLPFQRRQFTVPVDAH